MELTLVVVTWKSAREVPALAESVDRHLGSKAELLFVDNASGDETVDVIRKAAPSASLHELDENAGFGPANNIGVREASCDVVALINPDTVLLDDSLLRLAEMARGERALFAPRLLNPDHTNQISAYAPLASWQDALAAVVPGPAMPKPLAERCVPWRADRRVEVGWVSGACVLGRRDLLAELGPFDARLVLYGEDADMCLRARSIGVPSYFAPDAARIVHIGNASGSQQFDDVGAARKVEALRWIVRNRLGGGRYAWFMATQIVTFGSRWLAKVVLRRDRSVEAAWLRPLLRALRTGDEPRLEPLPGSRAEAAAQERTNTTS